jgi:hypothetical protein
MVLNQECQMSAAQNGYGGMTASPSNPVQLAQASTIMSGLPHAKSNQDKKSWWQKALGVAADVAKVALPIVAAIL